MNGENTANLFQDAKKKRSFSDDYIRCRLLDKLPIIATALASLFCILTIILTIVAFAHTTEPDTQESLSTPKRVFSNPICVHCIKLFKNPGNQREADTLIDKLNKSLDNGIEMCCATNAEQMSALLEASIRKQEQRPIPAQHQRKEPRFKFTPVSAHKQIHDPVVFHNDLPYKPASFTTDQLDPLTEHVREVNVTKSALVIKHSGLYFVYLSLHFTQRFNNVTSLFAEKYVCPYLCLIRANRDREKLLQTAHTSPESHNIQEETLYTSGTFNLLAGDRLEVRIKDQDYFMYMRESSYLGLVMLASKSKVTKNEEF